MTTLKNGSVVETLKALLPHRDELKRIGSEFDDNFSAAVENGADVFELYKLRRAYAMRVGDVLKRAVADSK